MGYTIRGAVTSGKLFHEGSIIIFGPALVRAYELERHMAVYPRIIIDPRLIVATDPFDAEIHPIYTDPDGLRCINMLLVTATLIGLPSAPLFESLLTQIERLSLAAENDVARQKLTYLQGYARRTIGGEKPLQSQIDKLVEEIKAATPSNAVSRVPSSVNDE
jgi:hypothetical protein